MYFGDRFLEWDSQLVKNNINGVGRYQVVIFTALYYFPDFYSFSLLSLSVISPSLEESSSVMAASVAP